MRFLFGTIAVLIALSASTARADIWNLQLDQSQSSVLVSFRATAPTTQTITNTDTSSLAGTMAIDLLSPSAPFGTAQITNFESSLADGLNYTFNFQGIPQITVDSAPGNTEIDLTTFGAPGNVVGGLFTQTDNILRSFGTFVVNGAGFNNEPISFDVNNDQDFNNYTVSRSGDTLTVTGSFDFNFDFTQGVFSGNVRYQGNFVAFGAVPEPHSAIVLGATAMICSCLRRRR